MEERYRLKQWPLEAGGEKELDAQSGQLVVLVNRGSGRLQWSGRSAALGPDSIALLRPGAAARASAGEQGLELWQLRLQQGLLEEISCPGCDLEACFSVVPFQCAVVRLNTQNATLLRRLYSMLQKETEQPDALAGGVYRRGLVELLVAGVLRCCVNEERKTALVGRKRLVVDEVFAYINAHLAEPLPGAAVQRGAAISDLDAVRLFRLQRHAAQLQAGVRRNSCGILPPVLPAGKGISGGSFAGNKEKQCITKSPGSQK